ncbi:MAG TPA: glycoside hydrolase family 127 protein [Clostridia bacterium]|nr:glycoside hydrolase family 127 protein [Clostridia bacterium]
MANKLHPSNIQHIEITDSLFGRYVSMIAESILPYQWGALNGRVDISDSDQWEALNGRVTNERVSSCIDNFRIAAGEKKGAHSGAVFQDTDAYKWLEAAAYCIQIGKAGALKEQADELVDLIASAQQPDGYLNTYFTIANPEKRWKNLAEGHELYCAGHLIEAAVAYYHATGSEKLLTVAKRFADLIGTVFGPEEGKCKGYPGHQEIELALVKLYRVTRENRYLDLARFFLSERGKEPNYLIREMETTKDFRLFPEFSHYDAEYAQTHLPPIEQTSAEGHAVRAVYMFSAMADLAKECDDEQMKQACKTLWENITTKRMYITGGIGSSGLLERFTVDYDLPNDRMYCESCASIGLMMFGQRMNLLTRDASYYEVVERALCNTVLAGISAKGDRYFYVNPLEVWPDNCKSSTSMSHVKPVRQEWFSCACCPPNIARTLASVGQYIYSEDEKSIYINQFISSKLHTAMVGTDVTIHLNSSYMQDGCVRITVESACAHPFTVRVRVPSFLKKPVFLLDDTEISPVIENGYAVLAVSRAGEQTFTLRALVEPELVAANDQVRSDIGKLALMFGPFVYCLEEADNGKNLANVFVGYNAAIQRRDSLAKLPGDLPTLCLDGERLVRTTEQAGALYAKPKFEKAKGSLTAVPYCLWCNRDPGEMLVWMKAQL